MKFYIYILTALLFCLGISSCQKGTSVSPPAINPNLVDGCVISQSQVVETDLSSHQIHSYIDTYLYDSLYRVICINSGQNNDTDLYVYTGSSCSGEHNTIWYISAQGYTLSSVSPGGSYQYTYDGNGYIQLETFTDSVHHGGSNNSYTESYYWDSNGNLSRSQRQYITQPTPVVTIYSYTTKANQTLAPSSWTKGRASANLINQVVVSSGSTTVSSDSYTYMFDVDGKVAQYTDVTAGQKQTVYTLNYSCH
jgi:YD repeat-containing protein